MTSPELALLTINSVYIAHSRHSCFAVAQCPYEQGFGPRVATFGVGDTPGLPRLQFSVSCGCFYIKIADFSLGDNPIFLLSLFGGGEIIGLSVSSEF